MSFLNQVIQQLFGAEVDHNRSIRSIGGGCIHQAGCFSFEGVDYFIKWNRHAAKMFETEARGLSLLENANEITVPTVIGQGSADLMDFLCLEYFEKGTPAPDFWKNFGHSLADLHRSTDDRFGLDHDNFIGSLPQSNRWHEEWVDFFINQRLIPQVSSAHSKGLLSTVQLDKFEKLYKKLPTLIPEEKPSLLHGDLWSGNFMIGPDGQAVIFDPAVYYGHREAELAFTKMFGGFDHAFYSAYQEAFPLQSDHEQRVELFNLYPLLVHVNLFGSSYLSGVDSVLSRFA